MRQHARSSHAGGGPVLQRRTAPGKRTLTSSLAPRPAAPADPHAVAAEGMSGAAQSLPHLDTIQDAFGGHDVSGVPAFVGGAAAEASSALGAEAYASGGGVAFAGAPDLHTAAHEAAHVVQQRAGVQLSGGVGAAGDSYEQHADAVADRVVAGESAEDLLGGFAGSLGARCVQRQEAGTSTATSAPAPDLTPSKVDVENTFPLLEEISLPTPYGTITVSATLKGGVSLDTPAGEADAAAGAPAEGTPGDVELSVDGGPTGGSVSASNVLSGMLGKELPFLADELSLAHNGELSYSLGFPEVALPSFGPIKQTFQFQLVEMKASLTGMPEISFGTFSLTAELPVPEIAGVSGSISLEMGVEPNWFAIGKEIFFGTVPAAVPAAAAEAGAGLGAAPLAAGATGAVIIAKLVADAYASAIANGHAEGIATWYGNGYSITMAQLIYNSRQGLDEPPLTEFKAQCEEQQALGVDDANAAFAAMTPEEAEAIRAEFDVDTFKWKILQELKARE